MAAGCGYRLVYASRDPLGPFAVVSGPLHVPDAAMAAAVAEGARAELSHAGDLAPEGAATAAAGIEVELLRVDETSEGIALAHQAAGDLPFARAVRVIVIGRARLRRRGSAAPDRDTGDVRASEVVANASLGPAGGMVARDDAARTAARRLGEVLVRRVLGLPEPGEP